MNPAITAVLNGFKRPNLDIQMAALRAQTRLPAEVFVWNNAPSDQTFPGVTSAICSENLGVWARFAFALNAKTEYVAVFDDDTIPGASWFDNCLVTMEAREALLGTIGLLYVAPPPADSPECNYWAGMEKIGWNSQNEDPVEVDFVGHAWFFKRAWLSTFWRELPKPGFELCGEDMHFSAMLQKYLGVPTIVPPHPASDPRLWGSLHGAKLGRDEHSLWESNLQFRENMNQFFIAQRRSGWRLIHDVRR